MKKTMCAYYSETEPCAYLAGRLEKTCDGTRTYYHCYSEERGTAHGAYMFDLSALYIKKEEDK